MFTDKYIRNLKPTGKLQDIREKRGFGIRVKTDGIKIFFYKYQSPVTDKRRFLTLGEYPGISLADARRYYSKAYESVKAGIDPLEIKHQEKEELRKAPTVASLVTDYLDRHAKRFKRSWEEDERILNRDIIPAWGNRKATDIRKKDVIHLLDKIVNRGAPAMANSTLRVVRKMFNFAVEKDVLPGTPCIGIKLPSPLVSRDRALSESEIKTFWANLDSCIISKEVKLALRLILVTVQRPGEVIGMHTDEIEGEWWTLPPERTKNKKTHLVYLTATARGIIQQAIELIKLKRCLQADQKYSGYIFPCPKKSKVQPIGEKSAAHAINNNFAWPLPGNEGNPATENKIGIEKFTPHDLRRTANTALAGIGISEEVQDAIMNHPKPGIIRVYNLHKYKDEKQAALEAWSMKLLAIIQAP